MIMRSHRRIYRRISQALHRFMRGDHDGIAGVSGIEFAIVAPLLVLTSVCAFDLGMGFYRKMQVESAAQAGAQYAMLNGFKANSIANAVSNATNFSGLSASPAPSQFCGCPSGAGITSASCTSTCSTGFPPGTYAVASATGTYTTLLPYPGIPNSFTFAATSTVRLQ
jgi:Flp pilus assembly protein TadG